MASAATATMSMFALALGSASTIAVSSLKTTAACLASTDDEAFTYNKRISRLAPIQEHRMILKAIERGVPEESPFDWLRINRQRNAYFGCLCSGWLVTTPATTRA